MSAPSSSTRPVTQPPSDSSCIRLRQRRKVLFPHPDGPMTALTLCFGNMRETSLTTARGPYSAVSRTVSSCRTASAGGAMALPDRPAGADREEQHQPHQHQRGGPRETVPLVERARGVLVDLEREGLHRLADAGREVEVAERGEQQGRGFPRDARDADEAPRHDPGEGGARDDESEVRQRG